VADEPAESASRAESAPRAESASPPDASRAESASPPDASTGPAKRAPRPAPGWREVILVAVAIVAVALGAAAVTGLLPPAGQEVVFRTPLVIVVLLVGTVGLMVRLAIRRPPA
jgi:anti-sigma-K factor RskA